ncbi:hypothetical protein ACHAXN_009610 [Cyclotella atomus]
MSCCKYICCPCLRCCPKSNDNDKAVPLVPSPSISSPPLTPVQEQEYQDLVHLATVREIRCTIRTSTQAGLAAGLSVMAGTLVAGPVGAAAGGAVGTALAVKMSKNVVPLNKLLEQTPPEKRGEVIKLFNEAFREEFMETIEGNPELRLLLKGRTPLGVVRYMVDRDLIKSDKLQRLDGILSMVV